MSTRYRWHIKLTPGTAFKYEVRVYYDGKPVGRYEQRASFLWSAKWVARRTIRQHRAALKQSTWEGP